MLDTSLSNTFSNMRQRHPKPSTQGQSAQPQPEIAENNLKMGRSIFHQLSTIRSPPIYEDLKKQDLIRLIKLDPAASSTNKGYELKVFPFRKVPRYYGLSYCWGSSERATQIICNGEPLQISDHLSEGLKEIQSLSEFAQKWFWIDQICVNQNDLDERAHQVKLMREIYTRAVSTVIWLGVCNEPCEKAFSLAQDIFTVFQNDKNCKKLAYMKRKLPSRGYLHEEELLALKLPDISDPSWQELRILLSKAWFRRMWIIQEVLLSRNEPLLLYGSRVRNWEHVLWTSFWLEQKAPTSLSSLYSADICAPLRSLFITSYTWKPWGLQDLLLLTQYSQSTDPRDKIFSLLSIAAETQGKPTFPDLLAPDYKQEAELVYRDFTSYLISKSENLILFSMISEDRKPLCACHQDSIILPSWVPRFHNNYQGIENYSIDANNDNRPVFTRDSSRYYASKGMPKLVQESQDPNNLILQGLKLDTVKWKSEKLSRNTEPFKALRWCEEGACRLISHRYQTFQHFLKPFLHVLSQGEGSLSGYKPLSNNDFWGYLGRRHVNTKFDLFLEVPKGGWN